MCCRFLVSLVVVVFVLGFAACSAGDGTPTVPVSSAVSVDPSAASKSASASASKAALYAEAERVYRAGLVAQAKFVATGDYSEFPPEMAEYYGPEQLKVMRQMFEDYKQDGLVARGDPPVPAVAPLPGVSKGDSEVAIRTCNDARGLVLYDRDGNEVGRGNFSVGDQFLKSFDGRLKIIYSDTWEAEVCPIS